ncbi:MAG: hypothetical protein ACREI6_08060, partial [Candidatus Rokuibacteriota bacterium]
GAHPLRPLLETDRPPREPRAAEWAEADGVGREMTVGRMGRMGRLGRHDAGQSITRPGGALTPAGARETLWPNREAPRPHFRGEAPMLLADERLKKAYLGL